MYNKKRGIWTLNNEERSQWIMNDEGLYDWWRSTRLSMREFIRQNRKEIDEAILSVLEHRKPAHHLKYGPMGGAPERGRIVGIHNERTGLQYHVKCAPKIPKGYSYPIRFGDPDWGYGSVPVCAKCKYEITTIP